MNVWTRMMGWLGIGQRVALLDPFFAAINSRQLTTAGVLAGPDAASRKVAIGSAIRLMTNTARTMPAHAYRGEGAETKRLTDPVLLRDPDASGRGLADWTAQMVWALAARGNAFGHIVARTPLGLPATVVPLHPDQVRPKMDQATGQVSWHPANGKAIPGHDMMHLRMFPVPGAVLGLSPIEQHAETVGLGIAAEKFGSDFFGSGGHPTGLLQSPAPLNDRQASEVKSKFLVASGNREPVLLPDGITYQALSVAPHESQFLETQRYSAAECCRIFGPGLAEILGYETGAPQTYQNVVDRDLQLLKYTLDPYLVMVEDALTRCLPQPQYVKFNRDSLLRMNKLDRYKTYEIGSRIGIDTPNDQLTLEDRPLVSWGNEPFIPTKKTITERIGLEASTPAQAADDLEGAA